MTSALRYPLLLGMALVLAASLTSSQAMISFGYLSPEKAKEAGLEVRYRAAGPNDVWVEVSFPTDEKWKAFAEPSLINYVTLALDNEDDTLGLRTNLREVRPSEGRIAVSFTVQRSKLHRMSVWITQRITDIADVVRMKDYIALEDIGRDFKFAPPRVEEETPEAGEGSSSEAPLSASD